MPHLSQKTFAIVKTALFYLWFVTMGSIVAIPGPTITSIEENLKGGGTLNLLFVCRPLGYIVGAIGGAILLAHVQIKEPVLIAEAVIMSSLIIGVGFGDYAWKVYVLIFFAGVGTMGLNTGVNVCVLRIWGRQVAGYYQALHFSFGVGGLLAPLIAKPFIEETAPSPQEYPPSVAWAYVIVGCNAFAVTFVFTLFTIFTWRENKTYKTHSATSDIAQAASVSQPSLKYTVFSIFFVLIATFFQQGIEISYSQCVATYATKGDLQMSKQKASYLTAAFWAPYMVSRFVAIFITRCVNVYIIVFESGVLLIIAGFVLVFSNYKYDTGLWAGTVLVGWGCGPLFPAMITWFSKYIEVTFIIGSLFFVTGSVAEMVVPHILLTQVYEQPMLLGDWVLSASMILLTVYGIMALVFSCIKDRYHRATSPQASPVENVHIESATGTNTADRPSPKSDDDIKPSTSNTETIVNDLQ